MPYPFVLPTTSSCSFASSLASTSHPSLPLAASSRRGLVRAALKQHKRLAPAAQTAHLTTVIAALDGYLPYVVSLSDAIASPGSDAGVVIEMISAPRISWRPAASDGGPTPLLRPVAVDTLGLELVFVLSARAVTHSLKARNIVHPLMGPLASFPDEKARTAAVVSAKTHFLAAAAIYDHLARRTTSDRSPPCCTDIAPPTLRALSTLALAEATVLMVLKDDPYPALVAQERNKNNLEWMYKAPSIPKVRAHLLARLCLAAAEHAATASALLEQPALTGAKVGDSLVQYVKDLRRTCRAKACRFLGIDADLGGQTGIAIAWMRAGLAELGAGDATGKTAIVTSSMGLKKFKMEWTERREDRRVERGAMWGLDAGRGEEARVLQMLETKWTSINDTVMAHTIPPIEPLIAQMPLGRDIHKIPDFHPPALDGAELDALRGSPPHRPGDGGELGSRDNSDVDGADSDSVSGPKLGSLPGKFSPADGSDRVCF